MWFHQMTCPRFWQMSWLLSSHLSYLVCYSSYLVTFDTQLSSCLTYLLVTKRAEKSMTHYIYRWMFLAMDGSFWRQPHPEEAVSQQFQMKKVSEKDHRLPKQRSSPDSGEDAVWGFYERIANLTDFDRNCGNVLTNRRRWRRHNA